MQAAPQYEPLNAVGQDLNAFNPNAPLLKGVIHDRPAFSIVEVMLHPNEQVLADGKAMIWMDGDIKIETNAGEKGPACKRWCAGESCCQNTYTGTQMGSKITFGNKLPGDMLPFAVTDDQPWILTSGAFVCGTTNLLVSARWAGCGTCCCAMEGPFFTHVSSKGGPAMFYAGGYGAIVRHEIPQGKTMMLDAGLFFAANGATPMEIGFPSGGCKHCCFGGDGIIMKFHGPCVIYSQNRNPAIWDRVLKPRPAPKNNAERTASAIQ